MKKQKKMISIVLILSLMLSLCPITALAKMETIDVIASESIVEEGAIKPEISAWYNQPEPVTYGAEYVKFLQDAEQGDLDEYHGVYPSASSAIASAFNDNISTLALLPSKYDPRPNGVTTVKDQGSDGICWSYGAIATLETFLVRRGIVRDYSEDYYNYLLAGNAFTDITVNPLAYENLKHEIRSLNQGGVEYDVFNAMLNQSGPVLQNKFDQLFTNDDPQGSINSGVLKSFYPDQYLLGYIQIPALEKSEYSKINGKIERIKEIVYNYGAVSFRYYDLGVKSEYFYKTSSGSAYYMPKENATGVNHTVSIVGWDDNFSSSNFNPKHRPAQSGAFLIKNSAGTTGDNGRDDGYFYLSYYDYGVYTTTLVAVNEVSSNNEYDKLYSLSKNDILASSSGGSGNTISFANIYTNRSGSNEKVSAVGFQRFMIIPHIKFTSIQKEKAWRMMI